MLFIGIQMEDKLGNDTTAFRGRIRWLEFLLCWQHIASAAPNPIATRPTFPKMFGRSPTSSTTARNVQTAIPIRKMNACVSPEDVSNTRYTGVSSTVCILYTGILRCIIQLQSVKSATNSCVVSVFVGWHLSGGGSILLALYQIPLQPDQLSPKCLVNHPTSQTTVGNVQTAIAIQKLDACVSSEDDKCTHTTPRIMSKPTLESRSMSNMLPVAGNRTHVTIQKVFYDDSS